MHQNIHVLNPWNELGDAFKTRSLPAATYNPLDILDRADPNAVAIADALAAAICPAAPNSKDGGYWQGSAGDVLTAVFLWLADQAEERKTLERARQIVSLSRKEFTEKYLVRMAASEAFDGAIRELAAPYIDLAADTYSGIMSNLSRDTKFLSDPQVKAATATSSFSMDDLATRKTTVYVVIPTERMNTQRTWLRLIVAAAMHTFRKRKDSHHRCLFLIDEFAALGRVDDLPRDIAEMAGHGVDFALVVQGLDQLKDHYGEARGTILSNCAYKWFCNLNDFESAKYLSDTLGKTTVVTESSSESTPSRGSNIRNTTHSTTHAETARSLLNPDEILNLGREVAILIQPNAHPHYLRTIDYWNLPKAFDYLGQEHPSLYWKPPLVWDQNPYLEPPAALASDGPG
jgi:type IV secretion system protein VirD4